MSNEPPPHSNTNPIIKYNHNTVNMSNEPPRYTDTTTIIKYNPNTTNMSDAPPRHLDTSDTGDREPLWAAWCFASRSEPHPNQPKPILLRGPSRNSTLNPCTQPPNPCHRHGLLRGSLNEITTNGTAFGFNNKQDTTTTNNIHCKKEITEARIAMKISREKNRRNYVEEENDELCQAKICRKLRLENYADDDCRIGTEDIQTFRSMQLAVVPITYRELGARAHRVRVALKDRTKHEGDGKYKRLTLMGLPTEIHLQIMEEYFGNLMWFAKGTASTPWYFGKSKSPTDNIPRTDLSTTKYPLAILTTSRLLFLEGLKIFQENATFTDKCEPMQVLDGERSVMREANPWPNCKRIFVAAYSPDDYQKKYEQGFNHDRLSFINAFEVQVEGYFESLSKKVEKLDELFVWLGYSPTKRPDLPMWVHLTSRCLIISSLKVFQGKVKRLCFNSGDEAPLDKDLVAYARQMEIYVQGFDDKASKIEPIPPPEFKEVDHDQDEWSDDETDVDDSEYEDAPSSGPFNDVPSVARDWFWENNVKMSTLIRLWIRQPELRTIKVQSHQAKLLIDRLKSPHGMKRVPMLSKEDSALLGIAQPADSGVFIEIGDRVREEIACLTWPNSDLELAASVPLPGNKDFIPLPITDNFVIPLLEIVNPIIHWESIMIDFAADLVVIGSIREWQAQYKGSFNNRSIVYHIKVPSFLCPKPGSYKLVDCNVYGRKSASTHQKPEMSTTEIFDETENINPDYDGPEDDGLGWLDSEEGFEGLELEDRVDGELKFEEYAPSNFRQMYAMD